jgi:signal transduction histidine kinase
LRLREGGVFTLIGRDITERMRSEKALKTQAEELAAASEELKTVNDELSERQRELERAIGARSRFYASMSHELRTPINAILGYSSLMLDNIYGELNESQLRGIERTNRAAKHLLELVNDILDLSKIEAGKMELFLEDFDVTGLIDEIASTIRPLVEQNSNVLTLTLAPDLGSMHADEIKVRQGLYNLLSNAVKFTALKERAEIEVGCLADRSPTVYYVKDNGVGFNMKYYSRLFGVFERLHRREEFDGTGIGLAIVQKIVQRHGGSVWAESVIDGGATFYFTLSAK